MDNAKALETIKAVYDDGVATINGRDYQFSPMTHKKRRKVYAFFTRVAPLLQAKNFEFMDWPEWDSIEQLIGDYVMNGEGVQLNKVPGYWDQYPEDYLQLTSTALSVMSYPFLKGSLGS